jgi:hypothetical protein
MSGKVAQIIKGCTETKINECKDKGKICNPNTGRCNNVKKENPSESIEIINTQKTIHNFIKELKKYKTAKEAIENIFKGDKDGKEKIKELNEINNKENNTKSEQGFIYELLWDICIKFNITNFTNKDVQHGVGNINNKNNSVFKKINEYIDEYLKQGYISGNSGGYSDITFKTKQETDKQYNLNLVSVKYTDEKDIKKYDIQNLCTLIEDRKSEGYESINTLLFVKDKEKFKEICKAANQSSNLLIKYISPNGNYENVYDLKDLEEHYGKLYKVLQDFNFLKDVNEFKEKYLNIHKTKFIPRFHQELFIEKITDLIKKTRKKILVGAIPRSGKTYIMAGTILKDVIESKGTEFNNYLIITPAPNETLDQYYKAFDDYYDFSTNNIVPINIKDVSENVVFKEKIDFKGEVGKHNVFLISKQRLGFKDKGDDDKKDIDLYDIKYVEEIKKNIKKYFGKSIFKLIFFDEAHFGMSTKIAQEIFKELDKEDKSYKIYVTATYYKPKQIYNIEDKNIIKWDLNDIKLIRNIKNKRTFYEAYENLEKKFGNKILIKVLKNNGFNITKTYINNIEYKEINNIIEQYKHFPEPVLLTSVWDKEFVDEELKKIGDNESFGFDMHKLFMTKGKDAFKNTPQLIQFLEYYFGYYVDKDVNNFYQNKYEYEKRGIIPIIEKICSNNCRTLQPSHKTTQLWFLPPYEITKITNSLIMLLKDKFKYIFNNYMFYIAVDGNKSINLHNVQYLRKAQNIKTEIEDLENKLYTNPEYSKYEGLIILAGNRLQLGISLKNVDIVSLFTNITASDAIYQMLFRSMTEIDDDIECDGKSYCGRKKYGFMVDLNPQRTLYTIDYLTDMYLDYDNEGDKDKKYELIADLINIDKHKFIDKYNREDKKGYQNYVKEFFNKLYTAWDAKTENIKTLLLNGNIFDRDIFKPDYNIKELFTEIEKDKKQHKSAVDKPEDEVKKGKIKKTINDIVKLEKGKKATSSIELWAYLFAEIISILSLITSYTDKDGNECIFNAGNKDNFVYELNNIIENVIDKDGDMKDIFLHTLQKRIIIKGSVEEEELYNMVKYTIAKMKEKQSGGNLLDINKQIQLRKKKIYSINEPDKLLEFINDNLKPKQVEKKERGEVFTPMTLVNEMLDKLPPEVWGNKDLKWLDPAAGMGNFPVAIYMKLMIGLKGVIKDEEKRRKHILENMLYMVELDKTNVFMMKKIFCGNNYKLNIFEGSFIDFKHFKKINIISSKDTYLKFNIILGNPPFQYKEEKKQAQPIWHLFIKRSYEELLHHKGYLLFIHPSGWRDIDGITRFIYNYIKEHNLLYLSMTSFKEGQKIFNGVSTNFDYYLVQNIKTNTNITNINDIDNRDYKIDLNNWDFIPSGNFNQFKKLLTKKERVKLLHDRSMYGTDKDNTNIKKDNVFKYPICNSINKEGNINFIYSNDIKGHFGIPKVIWSNGAGDPIIDKIGEYGLSEFSSAIVDDKQNLQKIRDAMISDKFINLMKYLVFKENHKYNYKIIALFKKDFYKYF